MNHTPGHRGMMREELEFTPRDGIWWVTLLIIVLIFTVIFLHLFETPFRMLEQQSSPATVYIEPDQLPQTRPPRIYPAPRPRPHGWPPRIPSEMRCVDCHLVPLS